MSSNQQKLNSPKIKIQIMGVGGGASSIIKEIANSLGKVKFLIADTDKRSFLNLSSSPKIETFQFGEGATRGWGSGMNPDLAREEAEKIEDKIKQRSQKADLVILVSCLGGGVGSGASEVFARAVRESRSLCIGIFTLPFEFEGEKKMNIAQESIKKLEDYLHGLIVLPNEKILKVTEEESSLKKSLSSINQVLNQYLYDLVEMISSPGIINIDFSDLATILKGKGQRLCFGRGVGKGPERVEGAVKQVFENPFFISPSKFKKVLFNISGGSNLKVREVQRVANSVFGLNPNAKIIFGVSKKSKESQNIKIVLLGVGESSSLKKPKDNGSNSSKKDSSKKEASKEVSEEKKININKKKEKNKSTKTKSKNSNKKQISSEKFNKSDGNEKSESRGEKKAKTTPKKYKPKKPSKKESSKSDDSFGDEQSKERKSALEIKKEKDEKTDKELSEQSEWDIPSFLRKKKK